MSSESGCQTGHRKVRRSGWQPEPLPSAALYGMRTGPTYSARRKQRGLFVWVILCGLRVGKTGRSEYKFVRVFRVFVICSPHSAVYFCIIHQVVHALGKESARNASAPRRVSLCDENAV